MSRLSRYFRELIRLFPRSSAPSDLEAGDIFVLNESPDTLHFFDGSEDRTIAHTGNTMTTPTVTPVTDNAIVRFDGTGGSRIQNSVLIVDDSGNVSGVAQLTAVTGNITTVNATTVNATNIGGTITTATQATIDHDSLANFEGNEHIDWTGASDNFSTSGTLACGAITQNAFITESSASATLTDNTSVAAAIFSVGKSQYRAMVIDFSIVRDTAYECGTLYVINDGTNADVSANSVNIGANGVTFSADISGSNVRLLYTTTNTGSDATFSYQIKHWTT
jgi:hypothetical protein